jgi:hypothetical protein
VEDTEVTEEMKADHTTPPNYPVAPVFPVVKPLIFAQAESPAQIAQARELFLEYAQSFGFSLCFQNFDQELADFPATTLLPAAAFCSLRIRLPTRRLRGPAQTRFGDL